MPVGDMVSLIMFRYLRVNVLALARVVAITATWVRQIAQLAVIALAMLPIG